MQASAVSMPDTENSARPAEEPQTLEIRVFYQALVMWDVYELFLRLETVLRV